MRATIEIILAGICAFAGFAVFIFIGCFFYIFVSKDHDPQWLACIGMWSIVDVALFLGSWKLME